MKFCKKCGILYSEVLIACPKCGSADVSEETREALPGEKRRQWLSLILGIPALILLLYLIGWLIKGLSA